MVKKHSWIMSLKAGDEYVLIALALTLFLNLTSIAIQNSRGFNLSWLGSTIPRIADANHPGGPLAKLTSVTIRASYCSSSIDPIFIEVFATLPSVKIINAQGGYCRGI